jgi:gluconolactonase
MRTRSGLPLLAAVLLTASPLPAQTRATGFVGDVERLDPAIDALIPRGARIEKLAEGFDWSEGPTWRTNGQYLVFSDIPKNTIYRWKDGEGLSVFLRPSGFIGPNPPGRELGSNGLTSSLTGALVMADHGNRQVASLDETKFTKTTLADRYQGKRFNSPNDLAFRSNGDLYFTDPPFGLKGLNEDPAKELAVNGVYRVTPSGAVTLVSEELRFPNGIAFSPDERTLYVSNSESTRPIWMAYDVLPDGSLARGRVLFDATALVKEGRPGSPDGMRVDKRGNLFAAGPGGILVLTPQGKHIGTIRTGQPTANCAFGDDGSSLYITANNQLLRIRLSTTGVGF